MIWSSTFVTSFQRLPEVSGQTRRKGVFVSVHTWTADVYLCPCVIADEGPYSAVGVIPSVTLLAEQQPFGAGACVSSFAKGTVYVAFSHHALAVPEFEGEVL